MHNLSFENEFYLLENERWFLYQRLSTQSRFDTEAAGNLEMVYCVRFFFLFWRQGMPSLSSHSASLLEGIFLVGGFMMGDNMKYISDYRFGNNKRLSFQFQTFIHSNNISFFCVPYHFCLFERFIPLPLVCIH